MKFMKKTAILMTTAAVALSCAAFAGCNESTGNEATVTGVYGSGSIAFFSAYPNYTYRQLTLSTQTIKTYSDNRYELIVTNKNISGGLSFDPQGNGDTDISGTTDRGQSVIIYCGTYTATDEEGLITLSLASPDQYTLVISGNSTSGTAYYNTQAWTEEMTTASEGKTAEEYLATVAFAPVSVVVDSSGYGFDYINLTVQ